jgi:feruloyl esterase
MQRLTLAFAATATALAACGGSDNGGNTLSQLSPAVAAAFAGNCADLATRISFPNTTIDTATDVAAGADATVTVGGNPAPAHCLVTGRMFPRTSAVDGQTYAIGFQLRLPKAWNGRFFYQGNGGTDGTVVPATGGVGGGGPTTSALNMGFAVISSDAGHSGGSATFGIDPQARLDYGYQAAQKLTPMAKAAIKAAYGKGPDRSYFGGCSNGGRHTMVATARLANDYDGFLVGDPGFRLPLAATANVKGYQTYLSLASTAGDPSTGFTAAERTMVSKAVLAKCDALDGSTDGLIQDGAACQSAFSLSRDVPTCTGARDGTCLTADQKTKIAGLFTGATDSSGNRFYSSWPYDSGFGTNGWSFWKFTVPGILDSGAIAFIWEVPPENPATFVGPTFAASANIDTVLARIQATNTTYTESALSFMQPPDASNLDGVRNRGGKIMVYHGTSDPIFSSDDTLRWYGELSKFNGVIKASDFARYYPVPGMNHCSGGPATDQFDMLTPLVNWVENGVAPGAVTATARGAGNAGGVNADVPSTWAANRSRPLCPSPQVARYNGSGSIELASSFSCQ